MTEKQKHRFYLKQTAKEISSCLEGGIFIECGVKYGTTAIILAKVLKRQGYLFDTWSRFKGLTDIDCSKKRAARLKKRKLNSIYKLCNKTLKQHKITLCKMIRGDVRKTLPLFLNENNDFVVMSHLDLDLYHPTKISLELIWPRLHSHGAIFVHDYHDRHWKGITKCVDDFVDNNDVEIQELDIAACILRKTA